MYTPSFVVYYSVSVAMVARVIEWFWIVHFHQVMKIQWSCRLNLHKRATLLSHLVVGVCAAEVHSSHTMQIDGIVLKNTSEFIVILAFDWQHHCLYDGMLFVYNCTQL